MLIDDCRRALLAFIYHPAYFVAQLAWEVLQCKQIECLLAARKWSAGQRRGDGVDGNDQTLLRYRKEQSMMWHVLIIIA
jgi:hypothetical protein